MELLPLDVYAARLDRKRISAGVLFRAVHARVLLVETTYKPEWEIPGGAVEAGEPPWMTAVREAREEVGNARPLGRLLVIDHLPADGVMPEGLAFVFDGGVVTDAEVATIRSTDPEIRSVGLYGAVEVSRRTKPSLAARVAAALEAAQTGNLALCEGGRLVSRSG
jgi:8-oxo-dGTP pyrophosphatase MutT (NUDIX family)